MSRIHVGRLYQVTEFLNEGNSFIGRVVRSVGGFVEVRIVSGSVTRRTKEGKVIVDRRGVIGITTERFQFRLLKGGAG